MEKRRGAVFDVGTSSRCFAQPNFVLTHALIARAMLKTWFRLKREYEIGGDGVKIDLKENFQPTIAIPMT